MSVVPADGVHALAQGRARSRLSRSKNAPTRGTRGHDYSARDPDPIDALTERTAAYIKANAGKRIEEIGKALSTPTKDLALPIIRLLANKTIKKSGQKRATKYFAR